MSGERRVGGPALVWMVRGPLQGGDLKLKSDEGELGRPRRRNHPNGEYHRQGSRMGQATGLKEIESGQRRGGDSGRVWVRGPLFTTEGSF